MSILGLVAVCAWSACCVREDLKRHRLTNRLMLVALLVTAGWYLISGVGPLGVELPRAVLGGAVLFVIAVVFYGSGLLGGGDVKFHTLLGVIGGLSIALWTIAIGACVQLLVALGSRVVRRAGAFDAQPLALTHGPAFIGVCTWHYFS